MTALPSVVHICHNDISGGAAKAAYNIHRALLAAGSTSRMLVHRKLTTDSTVQTVRTANRYILQATREHLSRRIMRKQQSMNPVLHSLNLFPSGYLKHLRRFSGFVAHLHWLGNETISIRELGRICHPIVWTLHDMWPMCGAEHYDDYERPGRFEQGYTPETRPNDHSGRDLDRWTWERKRRHLADMPVTFVAPSQWVANCLKKSALFHGHPVHVIPNLVDPKRFRAVEPRAARQLVGLDPDRRVIVFGALYGDTDRRKGFHLLEPAIRQLVDRGWSDDTTLLVVGIDEPRNPPKFGMPTRYLGRLHDELSLSVAYSAGDVMVAPSIQETFGQMLAEAQACGTPVVAFEGSGPNDVILDRETGYLARAYEPEDLASGIDWVLSSRERHTALSESAKRHAANAFAPAKVSKSYMNVYKETLSSSSNQ